MKNVSCSAMLPYVCSINILHKHIVKLLCFTNQMRRFRPINTLNFVSIFSNTLKYNFFILLHLMLFAMLSCQHLELVFFLFFLFFWRRIMLSTFILKYPTLFYFLFSFFSIFIFILEKYPWKIVNSNDLKNDFLFLFVK